jgi:hypothetical protein
MAAWANELIIGIAYFLAYAALTYFYFGPKAYLLLTGADLNSKFQIVMKEKSKSQKISAAAQTNKGTSSLLSS